MLNLIINDYNIDNIKNQLNESDYDFKSIGDNGNLKTMVFKKDDKNNILAESSLPINYSSASALSILINKLEVMNLCLIFKLKIPYIESLSKSAYRKKEPFVKPTLEEVIAYQKEKNLLNVSPMKFFTFYENNGWKSKEGKDISNWKSLMEFWNKKVNNQ